MAKGNKYHYYVLVFTNEGPKYVTGFGDHHTAYWDINEKPCEMSASYAEDVYVGLTWNGYPSVLVKSRIVIDRHPYRYDAYEFKFEEKEDKKDD